MRAANAHPDAAGAQPGAAGAPAAARARPDAAAEGARADRRDPGAVRAVDVHRAVVAARGLRARRAHARARAPLGHPGDADAPHHPPRLARRLLAAGARGPRRPPRPLAARHARRAEPAGDGRRRAQAARRDERIDQPQGDRGAARQAASAAASGCGSTSCACRRRAPGSAAARTSTPRPRTGSARRRTTVRGAAEHLVRRYLAGFGPASEKDVVELHRAGAQPRSARSSSGSSCAASTAARRSPARAAPRPRHAGAAALPADLGRDAARPRPPHRHPARRSTGRRSSASRRRTRSRPSSSTARWRVRGGTRRAGSTSRPSAGSTPPTAAQLKEEADRLAEFHS